MAELTTADVQAYSDRLEGFDDVVLQALLDGALPAARRYCGWSVTPVQTGVVLTVDGPGGRVLSLPTLHLLDVTAVVEEGVALDVTMLDVSRRKGTVKKHPWGHWSHRDGAITVTMDHGFTESEAADWRRAVLRLVDLTSLEPVTVGSQRDSPEMKRKRIDDVEYDWYEGLIVSDDRLKALFSAYRILLSP
jgi:hypothetical protein